MPGKIKRFISGEIICACAHVYIKNINKIWEDNVGLTSFISKGFESSLYQIDREDSTESTGIGEFAIGHIVKKLSAKYMVHV